MNILAKAAERFGVFRADLEEFRCVWNRAAAEISDRYEEGTADFLESHHPELAREFRAARDELNDRWLAEDMSAFQEAVNRWKDLHLRGCRLFEDSRVESWEPT